MIIDKVGQLLIDCSVSCVTEYLALGSDGNRRRYLTSYMHDLGVLTRFVHKQKKRFVVTFFLEGSHQLNNRLMMDNKAPNLTDQFVCFLSI